MRRRKALIGALVVLALASATAAVLLTTGGGDGRRYATGTARGSAPAEAAAGSPAAFAYLSQQHTSRCDLQAAEILSYPPRQRLQGSCCSPMVQATYTHQVGHLRRYAELPEIPADPYDISAALARRLLGYDRDITLSAGQRTTYRKAMRMSREKRPCCCPCWRWNAFRGLSKHLIARRDWPAERLAALIESLDGCGGSAGEHEHA